MVQALKCAQEHQVQTMAPESFLAKGAETGQFMIYSNAEASTVKCASIIYADVTYAQTASRQH